MPDITYALQALPREPERYKLDLERKQGELTAILQMYAWGDHYFGVDFEKAIEFRLFKDARIEVKGKDQEKCRTKIAEVQKTLSEIFGTIPYEEPAVTSVSIEDEITTDVVLVVPERILRVVDEKISEYVVRDVRFGFGKKSAEEKASIAFARPGYEVGKDVPLKVTVVSPNLSISEEIMTGLLSELGKKHE
jgi:hypothetical protein